MDPKQMAKQTFDFYKTSFENMLNAMTMLQEQSQKMIDLYLDQMTGFPDEGKKAIQDWNKSLKKGSADFKACIDENFKKVEEYFSPSSKGK